MLLEARWEMAYESRLKAKTFRFYRCSRLWKSHPQSFRSISGHTPLQAVLITRHFDGQEEKSARESGCRRAPNPGRTKGEEVLALMESKPGQIHSWNKVAYTIRVDVVLA